MKLIEANRAKECASTLFTDPILKMAVNAVVDNCPGFELVRCKDCCHCGGFDDNGVAVCYENRLYVNGEYFCADGERRTDG